MRIVSSASPNGPNAASASSLAPLSPNMKGKPFFNVLSETRGEQLWSGLANPNSFRELTALQGKILQSKAVSPKDLILYQIKASQFGLGIELVSKVAESVATSIRKFQNNP